MVLGDFSEQLKSSPANAPFQQPVNLGDKYLNLTGSVAAIAKRGYLFGVFVASSSSGTLKFWDNPTAASGAVMVNTFTPDLGWNPCPFPFSTGLYVTVGGTIDCTLNFS